MQEASLRLFNAVQTDNTMIKVTPSESDTMRMVGNGYIFPFTVSDKVLTTIESVVGLSGEKANAAFHKSWTVVQDTPLETLFLQQIVHYITTYGFEALGVYDESTVYIPHEKLELPAIYDDVPLVVVRALSASEILSEIIKLTSSGIALMQKTLDDIMTIVKYNKYDSVFVHAVKNRELKGLLYDYYDLAPTDPTEFLRWLVSKLTDESLLIKNDYLITEIKEANGKFLDTLIKRAPGNLAEIFYRYKPLFLAMKSISGNKRFFNRLRKQAVKQHQPLPPDYLNSVTAQIKRGELKLDTLTRKLESASIWRKVRLAYALLFRTVPGNAIVYRIRNGRGWATEFEWSDKLASDTLLAFEVAFSSVVDSVRQNVDGQTIYIPSNIHYALPATEKQFTGHFPTGTYISVPQDMVCGIHWTNTDKRVDLDLSVIGRSGKIGWDASYRTGDRQVLFSGDMTSARKPLGASELFYLKSGEHEPRIVMVNYYNFSAGDAVETKIVVANERPEDFGQNYVIDIGNIIASASINITKKQNILGLIASVDGENRLYFSNVSVGNSITSRRNEQSGLVREYLVNSMMSSLDFRQILMAAGADVVDERPEGDFVDLSPVALDKNTIIGLLTKT